MNLKPTIAIIGAGPGGLTAGMLLSSKGYRVEIFEKDSDVGGRNGALHLNGFTFDIGPTFLMLKPVLEEVFNESGEDITTHLTFYDLNPMYRLVFKDKTLDMYADHVRMRREITRVFPGEEKGFDRFLKQEKQRYTLAYPCLQKDYSQFINMFNSDLIKFLPALSFPKSMHDILKTYFTQSDLQIAFTFQSKYLGMSPWQCPAAFMIIPYIEHHYGIQHVKGGLSEISQAMKRIIKRNGGIFHFNTPVTAVHGTRILLKNGKTVTADKIIMNADIGYATTTLLNDMSLSKKEYSCSTFMLYLGLDTTLKLKHHTIFFSDDYRSFIDSIFVHKKLTSDISFYVRNASIIDKTLAPKGASNLYILVPVPNLSASIDWKKQKTVLRNLVLKRFAQKTGIDIRKHIIVEKIITPKDWEKDYHVFLGATFNLAHTITQMLYFRPHNHYAKNLFLVGGGTHPGSGLPTIYESARISVKLIEKELPL